jgi:hypothetical protein
VDEHPLGNHPGFVARLSWGRRGPPRRPTLADRIAETVGRDITYLLGQLERRTLTAAQIQELSAQVERDLAEFIAVVDEQRTAVQGSSKDPLILTLSLYYLAAVQEQLEANLDAYEELLKRTNPHLPAVPAGSAFQLPLLGNGAAMSEGAFHESGVSHPSIPAVGIPPGAEGPFESTGPQATPRRTPRTRPKLTPIQQEKLSKELAKTYSDLHRMLRRVLDTLRNASAPSALVLRGAIEQELVLMTWIEEVRNDLHARYFNGPTVGEKPPFRIRADSVFITLGSLLAASAQFLPWMHPLSGDAAVTSPFALMVATSSVALLCLLMVPVLGACAGGIYLMWRPRSRRAHMASALFAALGTLATLISLAGPQIAGLIDLPSYGTLRDPGAWVCLLGFVIAGVAGGIHVQTFPIIRRAPVRDAKPT